MTSPTPPSRARALLPGLVAGGALVAGLAWLVTRDPPPPPADPPAASTSTARTIAGPIPRPPRHLTPRRMPALAAPLPVPASVAAAPATPATSSAAPASLALLPAPGSASELQAPADAAHPAKARALDNPAVRERLRNLAAVQNRLHALRTFPIPMLKSAPKNLAVTVKRVNPPPAQ